MLLAGLGIPVMAALNGALGRELNNPVLATSILFSVGLLLTIPILFTSQISSTHISLITTAPWYLLCGGAFVIFYILSITFVAPRLGISNAVSFVLLGQVIAMAAIDHYGFIGMPQFPITPQRALGLLIMATGIIIALNPGR